MRTQGTSNFSPKSRAISYLEMVESLLIENSDIEEGKLISSKIKELTHLISTPPKTIELLNYEGPVIKLKKLGKNSFELIDQWNKVINRITRADLLAFISGEVSIKDSSGKSYSYPEHSINAKPTNAAQLDLFIYEK